IRDASVYQEIGLHGGMTHLCWNNPLQPEDVVRAELAAGVRALNDIGVRATSFTFPRNFESCHHLLLEHGFRCYRGLGPSPEETLGRSRTGAAVRLLAEMGRLTPPAVWPRERLPGLWSIPSSLFLYRMSRSRARIAPLAGRVARARKGIREAARKRGVFHLWLHPENLTESPFAFSAFEQIVEEIARARRSGDVEVLTMTQLADRRNVGRSHAPPRSCRDNLQPMSSRGL
ncbi:MAG: hypothetical protein GY953_09230, partial [bacterium]|nr:hypothetical protein [bacterium]